MKVRWLGRTVSLLALLVLMRPVPLLAQSTPALVINPNTISWTASTDHTKTFSDGTAMVTRYDVQIFMKDAAQPFQVYNAGKPTPDASNTIAITNPAWFVLQTINSEGYAKVVAVGPGGQGVSDPSGPFAYVGPPAATPAPTLARK